MDEEPSTVGAVLIASDDSSYASLVEIAPSISSQQDLFDRVLFVGAQGAPSTYAGMRVSRLAQLYTINNIYTHLNSKKQFGPR